MKKPRRNAKKKTAPRKSAGRKKTAAKGRKKAARGVPENVRKISFAEWLQLAHTKAATAEAAGEQKGACLLPDPNGGPSMCAYLDKATCTALKGTWVGGPC